MKKKIVTLVMCAVLGLSTVMLSACGGSEEAQETATEVKSAAADKADDVAEAVVDAADAVSDETWASLQDVYASLVEAYNATVELYNDDSVAADASIEEALNSAKSLVEEIGDIDRSDVTEGNAVELVEAMGAVNDIFAAVIDNVDVAGAASEVSEIADSLNASLTETYAGITDDENTYAYLGFAEDFAALLFYDTANNTSGSFVGAYEMDEETGAITITDESIGASMTFTVEEADGGYYLDMGDEGAAFVEEVDVKDFVEAFVNISQGTEPQF